MELNVGQQLAVEMRFSEKKKSRRLNKTGVTRSTLVCHPSVWTEGEILSYC